MLVSSTSLIKMNYLKKIIINSLSLFLILLIISSCTLKSVKDLSISNHPAMLFEREWAPSPPSSKSSLGKYEDTSGGGGCSTCAH